MRGKIVKLAVILLSVVILAGGSFAYTFSPGLYTEGFEEYDTTGDLEENYDVREDPGGENVSVVQNAIVGDNALRLEAVEDSGGERVEIELRENMTARTGNGESYTVYIRGPTGLPWEAKLMVVGESSGNALQIEKRDRIGDDNDESRFVLSGSMVGGDSGNTTDAYGGVNDWHKIDVEIDRSNDRVVLFVDDSNTETLNVSLESDWTDEENVSVIYRLDQTGGAEDSVAWFDGVRIEMADPPGTVSGFVKDDDGDPIEGATVSAVNTTSDLEEAETTTGSDGSYSVELNETEYNVTASDTGFSSQTRTVDLSGGNSVSNFNFTLSEVSYVFHVNAWMDHGSTQPYQVTNEGADVTGEFTVSSSDDNVVSVDQQSRELTATSDESVNQEVTITAVGNVTLERNVTVANRTLANIGIMPPEAWLGAFLGIDGDSTEGGIGATDIQWIYIIVITMTAITFITDNSWVGIGTCMVLVFLFWVIDFVGADVLVSSLFFAIFISISLLDVDRGSETNVTVERGF